MRAFVALDLPAHVRAELATAAGTLRGIGDVRFVRPEQLHVTLRFLGDVDDRQVAAMREIVTSGPWPALSLRLEGLGRFPPRGAPRVLWAGLAGDVAALSAVAEQVDSAAAAAGLPHQVRPFRAHITLGRCRSARGATRLARVLQDQSDSVRSEPWSPPAVVLYRSDPEPTGPVYRELARGALPAGG